MKLISFYLPQFHEIPENNDAWGNGFTEWTNVKKAQSLYLGHYQPRIPLHNNYYNLLNVHTMEWQDRLARKVGIYGFCFYHYWFNGRLVLEKPVENWLKDKKIKTNFCFAWANEPLTKTWHGAGDDDCAPLLPAAFCERGRGGRGRRGDGRKLLLFGFQIE